MPQYFFILGKNPTLSSAEIISVLHEIHIAFVVKILSEEVFVIETSNDISAENLMKTLGGTIKIGKIIDEVGLNEDEQNFEEIFEGQNIADNYLSTKEGKLHFGISIYDGGAERKYLGEISNRLKDLCITVKQNLQNISLKAGFVRIKERYLSSVSVAKNKLLGKGVEIILILTNDRIFAGKTVAVQEFESFSFRDYGRPQRDTRAGIIPPKLARMMINLAAVDTDKVLMDPFCGSGTIIQEAVLLGYKNIYGSDISGKAVSDTRANIDWLFNNFRQLNKSSYNIKTLISDVKSISQIIHQNSIDAIITEPYLGPPLFKKPSYETVNNTLLEVGKLYLSAFSEFKKILKIGGKAIMVFPAFEDMGKMYFVEILGKIKEIGFLQLELIPTEMTKNNLIQLTNRNTIIYGGNEQFVRREILLFKRQN